MTSSVGLKIRKLGLCNFRSFYGPDNVLDLEGKNLLLYGENGSGKSSLTIALQRLMEASRVSDTQPKFERNIFVVDDAPAHVKLELTNGEACHWDEKTGFKSSSTGTTLVDGAKANTFLDYRLLLKTYFNKEGESINFFELLVEGILVDSKLGTGADDRTLGDAWKQLGEQLEEIKQSDNWTTEKLRDELEQRLDEEETARIAEQIQSRVEGLIEQEDETSEVEERERARECYGRMSSSRVSYKI